MTPAPDRLLVVEPMSSGLSLLGAARDLGLRTVVFSFDQRDRVVPAAARPLIDHFVTVDTNDPAAMAVAADEVHADSPLRGVVSGSEFYVDDAARLAHRLHLPGLPPDTAEAVRDKSVMRTMLQKAGIRIPRFATVDGEPDLADAAAHTGFPAVLKPVAGSGSIRVTRVDDAAALGRAYRELALDGQYVFDQPEDGRALLEEYLDGPEYSVEGYVTGGEVRVLTVTDKILGAEPYFVELGHVVQADLPAAARQELAGYVTEVVRALDVTLGPFHAEVRCTATGPVLVEIGARLAGDRIADLVRLVTGVSLRHVMVAAHAGLDLPAQAFAEPESPAAAVHFFTAPGLRRLSGTEGLDAVRDHPATVELMTYYGPGDAIPPARDLRCRLGHVVYRAGDTADAARLRDEFTAAVRFR